MTGKDDSSMAKHWQSREIFILTHPNADTSSEAYILLVKVLETLAGTVKIDTKLPDAALKAAISLFVIDVEHRDCNELISPEIKQLAMQHHVVLFNAERGTVSEKTALFGNVKGLLYQDASPQTLFNGITSVLEGELWFCQHVVASAFSELLSAMPKPIRESDIIVGHDELNQLTTREKSVIKLIASGAKNEDIADQLNISSHTVKTHIYSAFKKTNSRNRVELANWALRHIPLVGATL